MVIASPSFVPIADGDTVNIALAGNGPVELVLSSDTIGRLNPQPDAIVPIPAGGSVSFTVDNTASKIYLIQLRPPNRKVSNPGTMPETPGTRALMLLPYVTTAASGVVGGLEGFP
jgi:hypothetical protein